MNSNWWPLLLPLGYGMFRFIEYWLKRRVEKKPAVEAIEQYSKLADLHAKLQTSGMTIGSLNQLRAEMLGKEANNALDMASRYSAVAHELVGDVERIEHLPSFKQASSRVVNLDNEEALTQAEMNALSAKKAREADDELTTMVLDLMQRLSDEAAASLQRAQDIWREYRKEESKRAGLVFEGGSMQPLVENTKSEAMTRERIAALRGDVKSPDGSVLSVHRSQTPTNLLQHIQPGVPKKRVEELLGTPTYIHGSQWFYRYVETQVELTFSDEGGLFSVVVALCHDQIYDGYNEVVDVPLGRLTLADLLEIDPQIQAEFHWSMRTQELTVLIRMGPAGAWSYYYFGALKVLTGAGYLQDTHFDWDMEAGRLISDPKEVLINWMALPSSTLNPPGFNWFIGP